MRVLGVDASTLDTALVAVVAAPWILCFLYGLRSAVAWTRRHELNEPSFWRGWRRIERWIVLCSLAAAGLLIGNTDIRGHEPRSALLVGLLFYPWHLLVGAGLYFIAVCGITRSREFPRPSYLRTPNALLLRLAKFSALAPLLPLVAFLIGVGR